MPADLPRPDKCHTTPMGWNRSLVMGTQLLPAYSITEVSLTDMQGELYALHVLCALRDTAPKRRSVYVPDSDQQA